MYEPSGSSAPLSHTTRSPTDEELVHDPSLARMGTPTDWWIAASPTISFSKFNPPYDREAGSSPPLTTQSVTTKVACRTFGGVTEGLFGVWRITVGVESLSERFAVRLDITLEHQDKLCIVPLETWMWSHTDENGIQEALEEVKDTIIAKYSVRDEDFTGLGKRILQLSQLHPEVVNERDGRQEHSRFIPIRRSSTSLLSRRIQSASSRGMGPLGPGVRRLTIDGGSRGQQVDSLHQTIRLLPTPSSTSDAQTTLDEAPFTRLTTHFYGWRIDIEVSRTSRLNTYALSIVLEHYTSHFIAFNAWQDVHESNDICVSLWQEASSHLAFSGPRGFEHAQEMAYRIRKAVATHLQSQDITMVETEHAQSFPVGLSDNNHRLI